MSGDDALPEAIAQALADSDASAHGTYTWDECDGELRDDYRRYADAVLALPEFTAYVDRRARERAVEELRAAADWLAAGAAGRPGPLRMVARKLHDRADALAPPDGGWAWRRTAMGWASDALADDDQAQR